MPYSSRKGKSRPRILLAANFAEIRRENPRIGYETALVRLMEKNTVAQTLHLNHLTNKAKYKSLEKIIDAKQAKISLNQSIMKWVKENG